MTRDHDESLSAPLAKLQRALCAALRKGAPLDSAAASLGLNPKEVSGWIALAENIDPERPPPPELVHFATAIRTAEAQAELRLIEAITAAAHAGDVRAAFWLLERRRASSVAASSSHSVAVAADLSTLSDKELECLARGEPLVEVPPGRLTQRDLERMTGEQLVSLVRQGRIMPAGPVIYLSEEDPEGRC